MQEISSFYTSVPKTTIIWGTVPEIQSETDRIFYHFEPFFFPFPPLLNNLENQNFEKMKKVYVDVIILRMFTKNHDHVMYASWDMDLDRQFGIIFCPFTTLATWKIKILKKGKKLLEISSFYTCVLKRQSYDGFWDMECDRQNF